jgi:large subunit ribosomal protein L21
MYLCGPKLYLGYFIKIKTEKSMFAIVSIAGQQFKVEEGQQIFVHRLAANEGDSLTFDNVHLVDNDGKVRIGEPNVKGVSVKASIISHVKGDKVIVFKKKRRKGYRVKNGHRQQFTQIKIDSIAG